MFQCNVSHHPTIGDTNSNRYLKVMFKISKNEHLPTPEKYYKRELLELQANGLSRGHHMARIDPCPFSHFSWLVQVIPPQVGQKSERSWGTPSCRNRPADTTRLRILLGTQFEKRACLKMGYIYIYLINGHFIGKTMNEQIFQTCYLNQHMFFGGRLLFFQTQRHICVIYMYV